VPTAARLTSVVRLLERVSSQVPRRQQTLGAASGVRAAPAMRGKERPFELSAVLAGADPLPRRARLRRSRKLYRHSWSETRRWTSLSVDPQFVACLHLGASAVDGHHVATTPGSLVPVRVKKPASSDLRADLVGRDQRRGTRRPLTGSAPFVCTDTQRRELGVCMRADGREQRPRKWKQHKSVLGLDVKQRHMRRLSARWLAQKLLEIITAERESCA
jgi:hypothetical protein